MNVWYIHHARIMPDVLMVLQTIRVFVLMVILVEIVPQRLMNVWYIHHARIMPDVLMVLQTIPVFVLMVILEEIVP
jgi:lipopolysaccharide/colanic/teichoic acid biosynthesis glycosyltransferase